MTYILYVDVTRLVSSPIIIRYTNAGLLHIPKEHDPNHNRRNYALNGYLPNGPIHHVKTTRTSKNYDATTHDMIGWIFP